MLPKYTQCWPHWYPTGYLLMLLWKVIQWDLIEISLIYVLRDSDLKVCRVQPKPSNHEQLLDGNHEANNLFPGGCYQHYDVIMIINLILILLFIINSITNINGISWYRESIQYFISPIITNKLVQFQFCNIAEIEPVPTEETLVSAFQKLDEKGEYW